MTTIDLEIAAEVERRRHEPEERRTHCKLRHSSQLAGGRWEARFCRKLTFREGRKILRAARMMQERSKKPGDRRGCLGHEALVILEMMVEQLGRTGRFDMTYQTIARLKRMAVSCAKAAMKRLQEHGFVSWVRRCVPTGRQGERGPQYEQTSNLYRVALPKVGQTLLDRLRGRTAPAVPVDAEAAHQAAASARAAEIRAMAEESDEADALSTPGSDASPELRALMKNAGPHRGLNPRS